MTSRKLWPLFIIWYSLAGYYLTWIRPDRERRVGSPQPPVRHICFSSFRAYNFSSTILYTAKLLNRLQLPAWFSSSWSNFWSSSAWSAKSREIVVSLDSVRSKNSFILFLQKGKIDYMYFNGLISKNHFDQLTNYWSKLYFYWELIYPALPLPLINSPGTIYMYRQIG